ncbi:12355_t:CDS:2 [Ambispora leptoticha]|uniref:12355_t:CDS:1 n=1 Tax=Ambispora leptoticha TaxID=144679 RepID=A0A9N8W4U0_9GLOM|nr:12355_t:CDS:2 [Ambispora leptoticha]
MEAKTENSNKQFSSKIKNLKFMQRTRSKEEREKEEQAEKRAISEAHWVIETEETAAWKPKFEVEYEPSYLPFIESSISLRRKFVLNSTTPDIINISDSDNDIIKSINRIRIEDSPTTSPSGPRNSRQMTKEERAINLEKALHERHLALEKIRSNRQLKPQNKLTLNNSQMSTSIPNSREKRRYHEIISSSPNDDLDAHNRYEVNDPVPKNKKRDIVSDFLSEQKSALSGKVTVAGEGVEGNSKKKRQRNKKGKEKEPLFLKPKE